MIFINKDNLKELDSIVSRFTSSDYQTRYDIITNPENTKEAYFSVLCANMPIARPRQSVEERNTHFNDLLSAIQEMIAKAKLEDVKVVASYTPIDEPTIIEVSITGDFSKD